jgi:hypothetical protein
VAHINDIPTNRSLVSTSSDFTTHNLYIESLKELLAAVQEYVAKERVLTRDKPDPADLLRTELEAQCKQFDLIMKQNSALLAVMAEGTGGGSGGSGGSGAVVAAVAAVVAAATNAVTKAPRLCAQTATSWLSTWRLTVSRSQQTRTRFQPGTSPPNWIDRDRGPFIVLILTIGYSIINQNVCLQPSPYKTIGPPLLAKSKH